MRNLVWLAISVAACGGSSGASPQRSTPPAADPAPPSPSPAVTAPHASSARPIAQPRPVTNTYHSVAVVDSYQWLEGDTDEVKAWSDGQNQVTRKHLDA